MKITRKRLKIKDIYDFKCFSFSFWFYILFYFSSFPLFSEKLFIVSTKKWRHTIQMTNDRQIHRLNYQLQASIHFNWPMVGQYNLIFIGTIKSFISNYVFLSLSKINFKFLIKLFCYFFLALLLIKIIHFLFNFQFSFLRAINV